MNEGEPPHDEAPMERRVGAPTARSRRVGLLVVLAVALAVYFVLLPRWPKDQTLHVVLGDARAAVEEVRVRYGEAGESGEDWTREVTFRYANGTAPRVLTHEARLPDGEYVVEIDVLTTNRRETFRRRVTLSGGTTSIDLSEAGLSEGRGR